MQQERLSVNDVVYVVNIDHGLSWRDCPFYKVFVEGVCIAENIGGRESAREFVRNHSREKAREALR